MVNVSDGTGWWNEWRARQRLYATILATAISERLSYRGDFVFATCVRFLPIIAQIFLWAAIYGADAAVISAESPRLIHGYAYQDMVAYYLLAMVGRAFSSMPGLSTGIAKEIRDGSIKRYLTQPVDLLAFLFCTRLAHKLVYYLVAGLPFAGMFWLCGDYFRHTPLWTEILGFCYALLLAFLLGFLLEALIGLIGFWFLEVSSVVFIFMMITYFLSGHMLPLDWFPPAVSAAVQLLPFRFLAHLPASVMLGRTTGAALAGELIAGTVWVVVLGALCRLAYARGVRRYSAFGG